MGSARRRRKTGKEGESRERGDGNVDGTSGRCFGAKHTGGAAGRVGTGEREQYTRRGGESTGLRGVDGEGERASLNN